MDDERDIARPQMELRAATIEERLIRSRNDCQSRIDDINMVLTVIAGKPEIVEMHNLLRKVGV